MSFNKITIIGNLGRDPELRYTPQGDAVCNFSVAVNEKKRDKAGELHDITTWFRVTLWRRLAENASKYLTKGSPIYIEGRLSLEEWTDRDGKNRYSLEITATDMQFIGGGKNEDVTDHSHIPSNEEFSGTLDNPTDRKMDDSNKNNEDDIPF